MRTFVAEPKEPVALFESAVSPRKSAARRHQHRCEVLCAGSAGETPSDRSGVNERYFHSIMVHYENDLPVQIESLRECGYCRRLPDAGLLIRTTYACCRGSRRLTEGEHIVEAVRATAEVRVVNYQKHEPCRHSSYNGRVADCFSRQHFSPGRATTGYGTIYLLSGLLPENVIAACNKLYRAISVL